MFLTWITHVINVKKTLNQYIKLENDIDVTDSIMNSTNVFI